MNNTENQLASYLQHFDTEIASLALQLREYILKETQPAYELVGDSTISLNIGLGLLFIYYYYIVAYFPIALINLSKSNLS